MCPGSVTYCTTKGSHRRGRGGIEPPTKRETDLKDKGRNGPIEVYRKFCREFVMKETFQKGLSLH